MEIILMRDVEKVGDKHEIVTVKDGYGRNFLIPKGFAIIANATNRAKLDEIKAKEAAEEQGRIDEYKAMSEKITASPIKIGAKAGTSGKIFGSVTAIQLSQAIKEQLNLDVERKKISLPDEVKELGTYTGTVKFHPEVVTEFSFEVFAE